MSVHINTYTCKEQCWCGRCSVGSNHSCVFYGYSKLVCYILYVIWRYLWSILSSWRDSNSCYVALRFESLPGAFNGCLIPHEKSKVKKKGLKATLSRQYDALPSHKGKEAARFAQLWNKIITSF